VGDDFFALQRNFAFVHQHDPDHKAAAFKSLFPANKNQYPEYSGLHRDKRDLE
jgi:hypothetical protein